MINYKSNNKKGYEQMHLRMNVTFPIARLWEKDDGKGKKKMSSFVIKENLVSSLVYESHQNIVKGIKTVLCS